MNEITLYDFMTTINYRVTGGWEYQWECYGNEAHSLESGDNDRYEVNIIFDTKTQIVYEMCAYDYVNNRAYRWIHPDYLERHKSECAAKGIPFDVAWDDLEYIHLDMAEDILEKSAAIVDGRDYDTRVKVPLEIDDETFLVLAKLAHEKDITFNQVVEEAIRLAMKKETTKKKKKLNKNENSTSK